MAFDSAFNFTSNCARLMLHDDNIPVFLVKCCCCCLCIFSLLLQSFSVTCDVVVVVVVYRVIQLGLFDYYYIHITDTNNMFIVILIVYYYSYYLCVFCHFYTNSPCVSNVQFKMFSITFGHFGWNRANWRNIFTMLKLIMSIICDTFLTKGHLLP